MGGVLLVFFSFFNIFREICFVVLHYNEWSLFVFLLEMGNFELDLTLSHHLVSIL